jgi:signal transduction histidine kinase
MPIRFRFPLRFKILVALLFLVTAVVSVITFTMANLFHTDKKMYIHDLTSVIALHTAIKLRVADIGPGIPREIQSRIFEPFFTTKPPGKGTGLSRSVTYGIVHDHRGAIQIESEPGQGANFVLTFPVAEGTLPLPGPAADVRSG